MKRKVFLLIIFFVSSSAFVRAMMHDHNIVVRKVHKNDISSLVQLYRSVASEVGGIARSENEITENYISDLVSKSILNGLMLVAENNGIVVGSVSKYRLEPEALSHCFGGGTTLVHPSMHGKGIGKTLWSEFLETIKTDFSDVARVELFVRSSNVAGIGLYKKVGFEEEGRLRRRIVGKDGLLEDDLVMSWLNPNFNIV